MLEHAWVCRGGAAGVKWPRANNPRVVDQDAAMLLWSWSWERVKVGRASARI